MKEIKKLIFKILFDEIVSILLFGGAYLIMSSFPVDSVSTFYKNGIIFCYGISAVLIPFIVKYFSKK